VTRRLKVNHILLTARYKSSKKYLQNLSYIVPNALKNQSKLRNTSDFSRGFSALLNSNFLAIFSLLSHKLLYHNNPCIRLAFVIFQKVANFIIFAPPSQALFNNNLIVS